MIIFLNTQVASCYGKQETVFALKQVADDS